MTTEPKTRQSRELTAERFVAKLRKMQSTRAERRSEVTGKAATKAGERFDEREVARRIGMFDSLPQSEREAAVAMANSLRISIDREPPHPPPDDAPEERPGTLAEAAGMDEVPERFRAPLDEKRLAVGKGR